MADAVMKMYPRGFLGARMGEHLEHKKQLIQTNNGWGEINSLELVNKDRFNEPNPAVEKLYDQFIKQSAYVGDFDFKRRILTTALSAFGTSYFNVWVFAQYKSPSLGDLHGRFIADTLRFVETGKRGMALQTWNELLSAVDAAATPIGAPSEAVKEFFGMQHGQGARWNIKLTDVIISWCSKPNGLEDLLGTLHILFGAGTQ